jgi:chorismate dehydratase
MPYLNSDVFYWALPADACELVFLPPRAMAEATERADLDCGPLPMAEILRMGDTLEPLGDYCVATVRSSVSILLFTRVPAEELDGARIAVTSHTASSVQLMRVLFAERWGVSPAALVGMDEEHDAQLLIGDPALQARGGVAGFDRAYDLGFEWFDHTGGLPFVYARWVALKNADASKLSVFQTAFETAFEAGLANLSEVVDGRPELGMSEQEKIDYLNGFSYRMGDKEHQAVERFSEALANLTIWRPPPSLEAAVRQGAAGAGLTGNDPC